MKKIVSSILIIILLIYLNYWVKYGESSNTFEYIIAISTIFTLIMLMFYFLLKFFKGYK